MIEKYKKIPDLPTGAPTEDDLIPFVKLSTNQTMKTSKASLMGAQAIAVAFVDNDMVFTLTNGMKISLSNAKLTLKGDPGEDVQLRKTETHVQWKRTDQEEWTDIISLEEITGPKGDTGTAATVDAGTTTTLAAGESATVTNVGTTSAAVFDFAIPQGIQGEDGACVESVAFVGNDMVFTLDDATTVTLTGAKTDLKGEQGDTGASITSAAFVGDDLVFTKDDSSTVTLTGALTSLKGEKGDDGDAATIAVGTVTTVASTVPASVTNVGTSAAAIFDFEIPKGTDGAGSGDMIKATYDPANYNSQLEAVSNKKTSLVDDSDTFYPSQKAVKTAVDAKQDILAFTPEDSANKENTTINTSTTKYPTVNLLKTVKDVADAKMSNPMSDTGDIIYGGASGVATRLVKGDDGQILELESGAPAWKTKGVTPINAQTGNYTLVLSDIGKLITLTSSSAITLTIPTNFSVAFPIGTQIDLSQMGTGKVTFAGAGVTINSKGGNKAIADKFVGVSLIKTDTNTWLLVGDLIA